VVTEKTSSYKCSEKLQPHHNAAPQSALSVIMLTHVGSQNFIQQECTITEIEQHCDRYVSFTDLSLSTSYLFIAACWKVMWA